MGGFLHFGLSSGTTSNDTRSQDNVNSRKWLALVLTGGALTLGVAACGDDSDSTTESGGDTPTGLSGSIVIDGSSTVGPLTKAVAEAFAQENPDVDIQVGEAGTGGGFEKFCVGETDANDASRQIEPEEEEICSKNNVEYEELQVANDALTVVLNPDNPVTCLTIDQLAAIWGPDNPAASWGDVEDLDAEFTEEIQRFGPGTDSGTFDYFTEAVNGEEGIQTKDYNDVGEQDNLTVTGVQGEPGGIGYFGFSFYEENADTLKAAEIDGGDGCVAPSAETVQDGSYTPLGRGLYLYPSGEALDDETFDAFMQFYLDNVNEIAPQVGFIPLTDEQLTESQDKLSALIG
jgi:phosphate transport system substrate-binding protein